MSPSISILILLFLSPSVFCYVVLKQTTPTLNNPEDFSDEFTLQSTSRPTSSVIQKIPKPGENKITIEIPNFQSLRKDNIFGGLNRDGNEEKLDSNSLELQQSTESSEREPLSFREILTILALWNLSNAYHDYNVEEMKQPITSNGIQMEDNNNNQWTKMSLH